MCPECTRILLPDHHVRVTWGRSCPSVQPQDSEPEVGAANREDASKRGFGGAQWRQCASQPCQFWC